MTSAQGGHQKHKAGGDKLRKCDSDSDCGGEGVPNSNDFADVMNGWPQMDVSCEGKLRKDME